MIKMVALVNKKKNVGKEDFLRHWLEVHAPLERKWPNLKKYVISSVIGGLGNEAPDYDGMAELWFDDEESLKEALASRERQSSREDFLTFVENIRVMITREYVIHDTTEKQY